MDAPKTPIEIETPKPKTDRKEFDHNNFKIELSLEDNELVFEVYESISYSVNKYESSYSLEELLKLGKSFRVFDSIEEAKTGIQNLILKNKVELSTKANELYIEFLTDGMFMDIKNPTVVCEKVEMNQDQVFTHLINVIQKLEKRVETLEKQKKSDMEWEFSQPSNILTSDEEVKLLLNRLKRMKASKVAKFKLLYRASRDGDTPKNFHDKCDRKLNTITLVKTNKGRKFGGFLHEEIESTNEDSYVMDDNAFVFSLDRMKTYDVINGKEAYINNSEYLCMFGFNVICMAFEDCFSVYPCCTDKSNFKTEEDYELNLGERNFKPVEMEVYQVLLE